MGQGNILIVEDDNIIAEKIKKNLSILGYDIIGTITTQELSTFIKFHTKEKREMHIGDIRFDDEFSFDSKSLQLIFNNEVVNLSKKERLLLKLFMSRMNQLIPNETIEYEIWSEQPPSDSRRRTLVSRLRTKLDHRFIATYASEGYVFHLG